MKDTVGKIGLNLQVRRGQRCKKQRGSHLRGFFSCSFFLLQGGQELKKCFLSELLNVSRLPYSGESKGRDETGPCVVRYRVVRGVKHLHFGHQRMVFVLCARLTEVK